jgi:catechol 2,3-dioxygenase-like lactoylglutathione lyase family enzyme
VFLYPSWVPRSIGTHGSSGDRRTCPRAKRSSGTSTSTPTLFIEPDAARAGAGRVTLTVAGLDALLERLATDGIEHEPIETYSNGVRHVKVPDPDGNAIALAEPPQS